MRMHSRTHWIAVALVLAALMLTLNEAHGRDAGAAALPTVADAKPQAAGKRKDMAPARKEVAKPKDTGVARAERSAVQKGKRAAKRTAERSRTGVGGIDSAARTGG